MTSCKGKTIKKKKRKKERKKPAFVEFTGHA